MLRSTGIPLITFVSRNNRNKTSNALGFRLTAGEEKDLVVFLEILTDKQLLEDARLSNPWKR